LDLLCVGTKALAQETMNRAARSFIIIIMANSIVKRRM
jgi:hypothetical protein